MDSAPNIRKNAPTTPRSSTTSPIPADILQNAKLAIERVSSAKCGASGVDNDLKEELELVDVDFLAEGGYNVVWLIKYRHKVYII